MFHRILERFSRAGRARKLKQRAAELENKAKPFSSGPDTPTRRHFMPFSSEAHDKRKKLIARAKELEKKSGKRG